MKAVEDETVSRMSRICCDLCERGLDEGMGCHTTRGRQERLLPGKYLALIITKGILVRRGKVRYLLRRIPTTNSATNSVLAACDQGC